MKHFDIHPTDKTFSAALQEKIDDLTKPKGSLGLLEEMGKQIGLIQHTLKPELRNPMHIIFAADHGIVEEKVSLSPKEVTYQVIWNFLSGGAGVNFLAEQHDIKIKIVDVGVDYDFPEREGLVNRKIRKSTRNYLYEAAMTSEEFEKAIETGAEETEKCYEAGCNVIGFGEMGITNTSSSAIFMHLLTGIPLKECVGAGSGLDAKGIEHKYNVLQRAVERYNTLPENNNRPAAPEEIMKYFGGYEMVAAIGGMLKAAERKMIILVDGFIMTSCILAASKLYPDILDYALFGHQGDETGHRKMLESLNAKPVLNLGMRLGEGSGALCAYPIIRSAVLMMNRMNSFSTFDITKYF